MSFHLLLRLLAFHLLLFLAVSSNSSGDHVPNPLPQSGNRRLISASVGDALDPTQAPQCADALCLVQALLNKRPQIYVTGNIDLQGVGILPSVVNGEVSITGLCDVSRCRIDAKGQSGIFSVGIGGALTLKDLELTGGFCTEGSAVLVSGLGADSVSSAAKLHALNVKFFNNVATGTGGAVSVQSGGSIAITNSVFYNNKATRGGAVFIGGSKKLPPTTPMGPAATCSGVVSCATFSNTEFARNEALRSGGAIFAEDTSPDCSAVVAGGPQVDVTACTFLNNTASSGNGGALLLNSVSSGTAAAARNSVFLNNMSPSGDGADVYVEALPGQAIRAGAPGSRINAYSCTFTSGDNAPVTAAAVSVGNGSSASFTKCDFSAYLARNPTVCKGSCNVTCSTNASSKQTDDQGSCFDLPPPGPMCPWRPDDCPPVAGGAAASPAPYPSSAGSKPPSNQNSSSSSSAPPQSPATITIQPPPAPASAQSPVPPNPATSPSSSPSAGGTPSGNDKTPRPPSNGNGTVQGAPSSPTGSPSKKPRPGSPNNGNGTAPSAPSSPGTPAAGGSPNSSAPPPSSPSSSPAAGGNSPSGNGNKPPRSPSDGNGTVQSGPSSPAGSPSKKPRPGSPNNGNGTVQSGPSSPAGSPSKKPRPGSPNNGNGTAQSGPSSPGSPAGGAPPNPSPPSSSPAAGGSPSSGKGKTPRLPSDGNGTVQSGPSSPGSPSKRPGPRSPNNGNGTVQSGPSSSPGSPAPPNSSAPPPPSSSPAAGGSPSSSGNGKKPPRSPSDGNGTVQSGPSSPGSPSKKPPPRSPNNGNGTVQSGPASPGSPAAGVPPNTSPPSSASGSPAAGGSPTSGKGKTPRTPSDGSGTVQSGPSSPPSSGQQKSPPTKKRWNGSPSPQGNGTVENAPPAPPPPPSPSSTPGSPPSTQLSTPPKKKKSDRTPPPPPQGGNGTVENAPPAPPPPPPSGSVTGDPHFLGKHGERFDFHGKDGRDYCVISDRHLHVNMHVFHGKLRKSTFISKVGILYRGESILIDARSNGDENSKGWCLLLNNVEVNNGEDESLIRTSSGLSITKAAHSVRIYAAGEVDIVADIVRATFGKRGSLKDYINLRVSELRVSSEVHGLLGQTYQESSLIYEKLNAAKHKKRSRAAQVFLDGAANDYLTTDVLTPDCKFSVFQHHQYSWRKIKRVLLEPMQRFLSKESDDHRLVSSCNGFGDHTLCYAP